MTKSKPFVEIRSGERGSTNRSPTHDELKPANALKRQIDAAQREVDAWTATLEKLQAQCKHVISQDSPGFPYDVRTCYVCGRDQGLV